MQGTGQELEEADYYIEMNLVVEALLKGETNATTLANTLNMSRRKVLDYMDAWKDIARNDEGIKERAQEALANMDRHFGLIIKEMWGVVNDPLVDLKTKAGTLNQIAGVESKRQETLQKAGLYDDAGIADELVDTQIKAEAIKELLRDIATKYPETKVDILEGLSRIFNQQIVIDNSVLGLPVASV